MEINFSENEEDSDEEQAEEEEAREEARERDPQDIPDIEPKHPARSSEASRIHHY